MTLRPLVMLKGAMSLKYKQGEGGASVLKLNGASGTRTAEGRPAPQRWPRSARLVLNGRRSGTSRSVSGFGFFLGWGGQ